MGSGEHWSEEVVCLLYCPLKPRCVCRLPHLEFTNARGFSQDRVTRYGIRFPEANASNADSVAWWAHVQVSFDDVSCSMQGTGSLHATELSSPPCCRENFTPRCHSGRSRLTSSSELDVRFFPLLPPMPKVTAGRCRRIIAGCWCSCHTLIARRRIQSSSSKAPLGFLCTSLSQATTSAGGTSTHCPCHSTRIRTRTWH